MTVEYFIGGVRERLNVQTDDSTISSEFIFVTGKGIRNALLRQEANKDYLWNGGNSQYKTGIKLKRSTISEADCFKANIPVYKSIDEIPSLIDTKYGKIILGVYFDNGDKIEATEYVDWEATQKRRFKYPGITSWFIRNNRLYVVDYPSESEMIVTNMEGIFEDPEMVDCEDACAYIGELNFVLPGYLSERVLEMTAEIVGRKYGILADKRNNGQEEVQPKTQS
jgi:hypothetical protein